MEEQDVQKSCWGVATWAVAIFLGAFLVFSLFGASEPQAVLTVADQAEQEVEQ